MKVAWIFPAVAAVFSGAASAQSVFESSIQRDFVLRQLGGLRITNARGPIEVHGWSMDKLRVKAIRRVRAADEAQARRIFESLEISFANSSNEIELSADYDRGLTLGERLQRREGGQESMELIVFAPAKLNLGIWAVDGQVRVKDWGASLEVRSGRGNLELTDVAGERVSAVCTECGLRASNVRGKLVCSVIHGSVEISNVEGPEVFVETTGAPIRSSNVRGSQTYVSKAGAIEGSRLSGKIQFQTDSGDVRISAADGFVSGRTASGLIDVNVEAWRFLEDKAIIESHRGSVSFGLPAGFSAELDLWAGQGQPRLEGFSLQQPRVQGASSAGRLRGQVGAGGELFQVRSREASVLLKRL